jgi:hypothetical protein
MRVMDVVIRDHGLAEELEERMVDETGNTNFWLGHQRKMDEDSDQEDPGSNRKAASKRPAPGIQGQAGFCYSGTGHPGVPRRGDRLGARPHAA